MALGQDFAAGYNVGLKTSPADNYEYGYKGPNPWNYLQGNQKNMNLIQLAEMGMGRKVNPNAGTNAGSILKDSQTEFLKRKEQELKVEAQNIANAKAEQDMRQQKIAFDDKRIADAEAKATGLRTENETAAGKQQQRDLNNAMAGLGAGDPTAANNYVNTYGEPGQNADFKFDDSGRVYVKFGDQENYAVFDNARDAIEKVLVPMSVIEQGIKNKMTDYQVSQSNRADVTADQNQQRIDTANRQVDIAAQREERLANAGVTNAQAVQIERTVSQEMRNYAKQEGLSVMDPEVQSYGEQVYDRIIGRLPGGGGIPTSGTGGSTVPTTEAGMRKALEAKGWTKDRIDPYIKAARDKGMLTD